MLLLNVLSIEITILLPFTCRKLLFCTHTHINTYQHINTHARRVLKFFRLLQVENERPNIHTSLYRQLFHQICYLRWHNFFSLNQLNVFGHTNINSIEKHTMNIITVRFFITRYLHKLSDRYYAVLLLVHCEPERPKKSI